MKAAFTMVAYGIAIANLVLSFVARDEAEDRNHYQIALLWLILAALWGSK